MKLARSVITCALWLAGCGGGEEAGVTGVCGRLLECEIIASDRVGACEDEIEAASVETESCSACIDGASCREITDGACRTPCTGVSDPAAGPDTGTPSGPSTSGGTSGSTPREPQPVPEEVVATCQTVNACQLVVSRKATCESVLSYGLQAGYVTPMQLRACNTCLQVRSCDAAGCRGDCQGVLSY